MNYLEFGAWGLEIEQFNHGAEEQLRGRYKQRLLEKSFLKLTDLQKDGMGRPHFSFQ